MHSVADLQAVHPVNSETVLYTHAAASQDDLNLQDGSKKEAVDFKRICQ